MFWHFFVILVNNFSRSGIAVLGYKKYQWLSQYKEQTEL